MMNRSHQFIQKGFLYNFENCLTIISSVNYCGNQNDGSIVFINEENIIEIFPLKNWGFFWHLRRIIIPKFVSILFHFDICPLHEYDYEIEDESTRTFLIE
jgi:hypothetical protein